MARKPPPDSPRARFATLLSRHLAAGTRPATAAGEPWTYAAFAAEVQSARTETAYVSERSVSNWCNARNLPSEIDPILRALFGPPTAERHAEACAELRTAFLAARTVPVLTAKPDPTFESWVPENDGRLVRDHSARNTDRRAAADPLRQQLQSAITRAAAALVHPAERLKNSATWGQISANATQFQALMATDPAQMPQHLGEAYDQMLRLGRFLETDLRVQRDPNAPDDPLPPDIHGLLTDIVRIAAPWLRGFPTIAAWDDAAGKLLLREDLFQSARTFTRIARANRIISEPNAADLSAAADLADP